MPTAPNVHPLPRLLSLLSGPPSLVPGIGSFAFTLFDLLHSSLARLIFMLSVSGYRFLSSSSDAIMSLILLLFPILHFQGCESFSAHLLLYLFRPFLHHSYRFNTFVCPPSPACDHLNPHALPYLLQHFQLPPHPVPMPETVPPPFRSHPTPFLPEAAPLTDDSRCRWRW